jgi:hypothetical protein
LVSQHADAVQQPVVAGIADPGYSYGSTRRLASL